MPYSIRPSGYVDFPPMSEFPTVPNWVRDQIPKNKRYELNYTDGIWRLNGKVLKQQGDKE
jgi:hypothetical protein